MAKKEKPVVSVPVRITSLEMTAYSKTFFPVPVNITTALMRAHEIPLPFYRYIYRQVGYRWGWADRMRMDDETLAARVHDPKTHITVLYVQGSPAGFFELNTREIDVVELEYFGLMEHALGLGIGKWFLSQALQAAWSTMPQKVVVETNSMDHPRALALYQRMGFQPFSTREDVIRPLTDAELLACARRDVATASAR